jgi:hypothetical protein
MDNRVTILMFLLLLITGCATVPPAPTAEDTFFYLARFDKVWVITQKVLEKESIPLKTAEKETGEITTKFVNYSAGHKAHYELDDIAEKPEIRLAIYTQVGYSLSIQVTPTSEMSTKVKINAKIEAYEKNVTQKWHECRSKNVIERKLLEKIRSEL